MPERFVDLDFEHFFLQPMDGIEGPTQYPAGGRLLPAHPQWRLSIQTHKVIGIA